jgi:hypothetical protein
LLLVYFLVSFFRSATAFLTTQNGGRARYRLRRFALARAVIIRRNFRNFHVVTAFHES